MITYLKNVITYLKNVITYLKNVITYLKNVITYLKNVSDCQNADNRSIAAELNNSEIKLNRASRPFQALKLE